MLIVLVVLAAIAGVFVFTHEHVARAENVRIQMDNFWFEAEGVVLLYESGGHTLQYLLYQTPNGEWRRVELKFSSLRGCNVQEGDLPCVLGSLRDPIRYEAGTVLLVSGTYEAPKVYVDSVRVVESNDFVFVSIGVGEKVSVGSMEVEVENVRFGEGCEVFLGCFKDHVPRADFTVTNSTTSHDTTMVPGMLRSQEGGVLALVSADPLRLNATFVLAGTR